MDEEWAREWSRWCAATGAPETPAQRYAAIPLGGWGPDTRRRPTVVRGAGPDHPWAAATGPQTGWTGDVSSLVRTPVPPRIVLHAANVLRDTEIRKWGHAAATVRRHPPEDGAAELAVAHFKTGGPVYDDALSRLSDTQGPLLLMLPTDIAAALRQELDACQRAAIGMGGSRGWHPAGPPPPRRRERVPMGCADAPPHRAPRVHGNPPPGAPPPGAGRPHRRPPRLRDSPRRHVAGGPAEDARQGLLAPRPRPPAGDPGPPPTEVGRPLGPPSRPLVAALPPPTHLAALRECDTVSSAASTGGNRGARCAQVAACPWPEPPAGPRRRTEEEALHRRIEGAYAPSHERAGPASAALLWIHVHPRDPTSVAHLSHVFAP